MDSGWVEIKWFDYPGAEKAILQVPVSIEGLEQRQFLQLDTGCPESILFGYQISQIFKDEDLSFSDQIFLSGSIGREDFVDFKFKQLRDFGKDRADQGQQKIGLLGTDFFRNKLLMIDFIRDRIKISNDSRDFSDCERQITWIRMRRNQANMAVFDVKLNGMLIENVLFDTGASLCDLTFNRKSSWDRFAGENDQNEIITNTIGSPRGKYKKYDLRIQGLLEIGKYRYNDPVISYRNTDLFPESGLNGVIGNRPFFGSCIVVDFKKYRFGIG